MRVIARALLIAFCGFAAWRSVRLAIADWIASQDTLAALKEAERYAADDARLLARVAISRSEAGDSSPAVDEDLRRAVRLNPLDSSVLMTLGMREEFRGDNVNAERYLIRAAEVDHQFKPAWTLANYYSRANQPEKGWPMIERILKLDPLGFDPTPVFELCWREAANNPRKILGIIPKNGHKPVQYLAFLMGTQRTEAALEVWPEALAAVDRADSSDMETVSGFADFLANADRTKEAVTVWNQLVDSGVIHSGRLDPAKGVSIGNPDFQFPPAGRVFDWRVAEIPGVSTNGSTGSLRLEISGDEPQAFQVLSTFAPVVSGTRYRLVWKSGGSSLNSSNDPGFGFFVTQEPGDVVKQCPALLESRGCDFASLPGGQTRRARIDLRYARAPGTTRVSGTLQLSEVRLEFAQ